MIFFLNVFSDGHEAATNDGDHRPFVREHPLSLFEQIPPKYNIPATTVGNPNTVKYLTVFGLPTSIPNTVKYRQIDPIHEDVS